MADDPPDSADADSLLSDWWALQGRELGRMTDEALKEFVKGVLRNEIFTSEHIRRRTAYVCPKCEARRVWADAPCPECGEAVVETTEPDIDLGLVFLPLAMGGLAEWPKDQIKLIGCLWAYNRTAFPRSINGYPMFPEMRVMHRDDWARASKAIAREQQRDIELEEE